jgi:hypothetical protein
VTQLAIELTNSNAIAYRSTQHCTNVISPAINKTNMLFIPPIRTI